MAVHRSRHPTKNRAATAQKIRSDTFSSSCVPRMACGPLKRHKRGVRKLLRLAGESETVADPGLGQDVSWLGRIRLDLLAEVVDENA